MKLRRRSRYWLTLLQQGVRTAHGWIVICGLAVGLCYLPTWLGILWERTLLGSSNVILNAGFIYLGLEALWKQRQSLLETAATADDRLTGHLFILGGAALFPFCLASSSLQALVVMVILAGMVLSTWGLDCFRHSLRAIVLLLVSVYPDLGFLASQLWYAVTPPNLLEQWMASASSAALRIVGQPAVAKDLIVSLPGGAVEVGLACSGFDMAFTLAGTGFILGLFFGQRRWQIVRLIGVGVGLALVLNIPRIMLLTIASVYWGKAAFNFWHGPIGGQIFAAVLFTLYYYSVSPLLKSVK